MIRFLTIMMTMKMKKGSEEKTQKKKDGKNETSGRKDKQGEYFFSNYTC